MLTGVTKLTAAVESCTLSRDDSTLLTLQLGLGGLPAGLGGRDRVGTGGVHERPLQHARPVLLARRQVALPPRLEVILAFPCTSAQREREQIPN